jgi:hypothetical protein
MQNLKLSVVSSRCLLEFCLCAYYQLADGCLAIAEDSAEEFSFPVSRLKYLHCHRLAAYHFYELDSGTVFASLYQLFALPVNDFPNSLQKNHSSKLLFNSYFFFLAHSYLDIVQSRYQKLYL